MPPPPWNARALHTSRAGLRGDESAGPRGTVSTVGDGPAKGLGRPSASSLLPAPRGERLSPQRLSGLGSLPEYSEVGLLRALSDDESYVTLGHSNAIARPRRSCTPPVPLSKWVPECRRGPDWIPTPFLSPNSSPSQTQILFEVGRAKRSSAVGPGTAVGSAMSACPPKANAEGI